MTTLWQNDKVFIEKYCYKFPGYLTTGDFGYFDENGYLFIEGRADDMIKYKWRRISATFYEGLINSHEFVIESAVIPIKDSNNNDQLFALIVTIQNKEYDEFDLKKQINLKVNEVVGDDMGLSGIAIVPRLPKTNSGKPRKLLVQKVANGQPTNEILDDSTTQLLEVIENLIHKETN